jgi:hypothetical protein
MVVWDDRDAVIELVDIGVSGVVNQDYVLKISIHDSKIFDMHAFGCCITVFSK